MKNYYLYGEILSETPKVLAEFLNQNKNLPVALHINSNGGNVFSGLAIHNLLKQRGDVEIYIDGLCGSAATLIACAGKTIKMAKNALYFIHPPIVGLTDYYSAAELEKLQNDLKTIKGSILTTYENRTKKSRDEIEKMVDAESWLSAEDALENNFIDEIVGEVDAQFDNSKKILFMNKVELSCKNMDFEKLKTATNAVERKEQMEDTKQLIADAIQADRKRIKDLNSLKCENKAINKILDLAIEDGKTLEEIKPYIDAVQSAELPKIEKPETPPENPQKEILNQLAAIIKDNLESGAGFVTASVTAQQTEEEKKAAEVQKFSNYLNEALGGAANVKQ